MFTALLIVVGQRLLNTYIMNSNTASAYGIAGSLIVIRLWIYYLMNILLFGAAFTQVYARMFGTGLRKEREQLNRETQEASPNQDTRIMEGSS